MKNLIPALIKAQSEFIPIKKDKVNPFFHSKYADLESVIECTKKALSDNGLVVIQTFGISENKTTLWTYLYHTSGEFLSGVQYLDVASDPQKIASASTYARRYGYLAILGIAAEDDDGNTATPQKSTPTCIPAAQANSNIIQSEKFDIEVEVLKAVRNDKKERSEYEVETPEHEHYNVYIKKPLQLFKEREKANLIGFREWAPAGKNVTYYLADDIKKIVSDETIPF